MASGPTYANENHCCWFKIQKRPINKYQTETESTLEGRKASLSVTFFNSPSLWYKERKTYAEEFNARKIYIEDRILEKKEVRLLADINSYYLALLQNAVDTDLKHITSSPQKLEAKILKCYPWKN